MRSLSLYLFGLLLSLIACTSKGSNSQTLTTLSSTNTNVAVNDTLYLNTYFDLDSVLDSLNFHLENVRRNHVVPRIFLLNIRKSLKSESSNIRKYDFMRIILSNALLVNEDILKEREQIVRLLNQEILSVKEEDHLDSLTTYFRCNKRSELLEKVDIIPPSLVICQAIIESGWGQSHFAYEGNSLFGEHAPANTQNVIKATGANIGLRTFPTIYSAIKEYTNNLNRHNAYRSLRVARSDLRAKGAPIDGLQLANTQENYSELGHKYVNTLRQIISLYHLSEFDLCVLENNDNLFIEILE